MSYPSTIELSSNIPSGGNHQRLLIVIVLSILLHALLLSQLEVTPDQAQLKDKPIPIALILRKAHTPPAQKASVSPQETSAVDRNHQDVHSNDPVSADMDIRADKAQRDVTSTNETAPQTISAAVLIAQGRALIRSGMLEADETQFQTSLPKNEIFITQNTIGQLNKIETVAYYPGGEIKVKMKSPLGGYQCFIVPQHPSSDDLLETVWRHSRC